MGGVRITMARGVHYRDDMDVVEYRTQAGEHYENDHRQAMLMLVLLAVAAIGSVLLILKVLL
jgi:hypothetical protein